MYTQTTDKVFDMLRVGAERFRFNTRAPSRGSRRRQRHDFVIKQDSDFCIELPRLVELLTTYFRRRDDALAVGTRSAVSLQQEQSASGSAESGGAGAALAAVAVDSAVFHRDFFANFHTCGPLMQGFVTNSSFAGLK